MPELARAHIGEPCLGRFRLRPEHFVVLEQLRESPSGEGEHSLIEVEKIGQNTAWVARWLARETGVAPRDVGYCGQKDRHARCRQWFSVPRHVSPSDLSPPEGVEVQTVARHHRKLRLGAHSANHFELQLAIDAGAEGFLARCEAIAQHGCPNWFGAQRFGRDGGNLARAREWFESGGRVRRDQRSFLLSAARSHLFNQFLMQRVAQGTWNTAVDGDILNLDGSGSVFYCETADDAICARVASADVHPTGPMWGRGEATRDGQCAARERALLADESALMDGLEQHGLRAERRPLRVCPSDLQATLSDDHSTARLTFTLRPGQFATAVLQEIGEFEDASVPNSTD